KMRFAFKTRKGAWSDIDMLAYNAETKHLVISESKVRGQKKDVFAYFQHTKDKYGSITRYDDEYFSFIKNLPDFCADGVIFNNFSKMVKRITIQLVSNYIIESALKEEAKQSVLELVARGIPNLQIKVDIMLDTTMDVMARVIAEENVHPQGRRYGHPMLDIAREFNRYFNPDVSYAGRGKEKNDMVKKEAVELFLKTIGASSN
ncbi:MAG: hypothetical protein HAW67_04840, partial [Endozoicomonadaceae bacterium]|nr:hypothetical protein [Endozoicomonadaceae bacterium]